MDELIASGLMRFTDLDRENGTLDLDKCGDEIPSAWRKRRSAEARKKAERSAREAAAKKAKAEREEKERQRLAARREAEAKRRADAAAVKARRSSGAAAASAKRRRGDAGASMLMAAVDFVESARREDVHSDDESRPRRRSADDPTKDRTPRGVPRFPRRKRRRRLWSRSRRRRLWSRSRRRRLWSRSAESPPRLRAIAKTPSKAAEATK